MKLAAAQNRSSREAVATHKVLNLYSILKKMIQRNTVLDPRTQYSAQSITTDEGHLSTQQKDNSFRSFSSLVTKFNSLKKRTL
ncbi:hypothetical protein BaRGS_00040263 [Batillaria attramentaria]|uniref:Uncharacterized protein n=1 Tax=Batillaria attramentaria TaxID=370345 RepID=A0ABD0J0S7_9CAEN